FEPVLAKADAIAAISRNDTLYFDKKYKNAFYIPAFHANEKVNITPGRGKFALYHGNLAVGENNEAALFLVNKVFQQSDIPLMIAGSRPSKELQSAVAKKNHITLLSDLSTRQIHQLISDAQVNILPTFQPTGIKLKLLSALYSGRFAVVNTPMVENTGLEDLCLVEDDAEGMRELVTNLMERDFTESDIALREKTLRESFSNDINVQKLINLFGNR
ncbi:MAG: glycosyltransferase family 4 protein, partial [Bacteroidota bacterium]